MDILAARKKAAEKARSRQDAEPQPPIEPQPPAGDSTASPVGTAAAAPAPEPETGEAVASGGDAAGMAGSDEAGPHSPDDAAPAEDGPAPGPVPELELLSFRLGGEEYAVMVDVVREVIRFRYLTVVPNAPEDILGVISLRGTMLPVVDLCKRLGLSPGARDDRARIVVVNVDDEDVGLLVDRVAGVQRIMPDAVRPAPENIEQGGEFLRGIARKDDRLFILLDLKKAAGR